ncbi:hypothetical protein FIBSPDRAFT_899906 [Athelia psychrophila]|uniref:Uncharacterized protein n=1 Tax=Athelia psychrophila TaxID=1759441 RepID=A0A165Z498_9AGAM|nr:hypothetical protein FIBSPDRAFT_899906 [Fibularhizoctonia sp. CBS 109695]
MASLTEAKEGIADVAIHENIGTADLPLTKMKKPTVRMKKIGIKKRLTKIVPREELHTDKESTSDALTTLRAPLSITTDKRSRIARAPVDDSVRTNLRYAALRQVPENAPK